MIPRRGSDLAPQGSAVLGCTSAPQPAVLPWSLALPRGAGTSDFFWEIFSGFGQFTGAQPLVQAVGTGCIQGSGCSLAWGSTTRLCRRFHQTLQ